MTSVSIFKLISLLVAAGLSSVLLAFAHKFRWERVFGQQLKPPWSYVAGILFLGLPYTALMVVWREWWPLAAAAAVTVGGGFPVVFAYSIRDEMQTKEREICYSELLDDEREINQMLRRTIIEGERKEAHLIAELVRRADDGADEQSA